jgi:hypothetical protein
MLLGLSVILAFISRGVFILYHMIPLTAMLEGLLARWAWHQLNRWHGLSRLTLAHVRQRLLLGNPFDRVGTADYASYRAALMDPAGSLGPSAAYWEYEKFLYIRASHFYGLFLTFTSFYGLYGIITFAIGSVVGMSFDIAALLLWFVVLAAALSVAMGLLQEVFIHGVAFVTIDDQLYDAFLKKR